MHHSKVRTMKEAYVSFEVAKLLKEKGFDGECRMMYREHDKRRLYYVPDPNHIGEFTIDAKWIKSHTKKAHAEYLLAPTLQMACAWLREKHLIHAYAEYKAFFQERPKKLYYHWIPFVKTLPHCPINKSGFPKDTISLDVYCNTYEDAVEAALKYSLENLI